MISNKTQFHKISVKTTMTAGRSAGVVEKSVCCSVYKVKDTGEIFAIVGPISPKTSGILSVSSAMNELTH